MQASIRMSEGFVPAFWDPLLVDAFLLLVHPTPQKLAQKVKAEKHPCCKLHILPVAPAWSCYLVSHLREQICLLQDTWRKGFLIVTRWCSSVSRPAVRRSQFVRHEEQNEVIFFQRRDVFQVFYDQVSAET